ncbi:MAG: hypothetical protein PVH62_10030, partial [Anaerolineae bacterium]
MNQRKLAFSIVLGTMLTLGLLATLSVSPNSTAALAEGPEAAARLDSDDVIRAQDAVSTAHLAVQFSNGDTAVRPITWTGTITRIGAMEAAGFDVEHDSQTVCAIEGDGCPSDDCFCDDNLWAQGQWAGTTWDTSAWPPP